MKIKYAIFYIVLIVGSYRPIQEISDILSGHQPQLRKSRTLLFPSLLVFDRQRIFNKIQVEYHMENRSIIKESSLHYRNFKPQNYLESVLLYRLQTLFLKPTQLYFYTQKLVCNNELRKYPKGELKKIVYNYSSTIKSGHQKTVGVKCEP